MLSDAMKNETRLSDQSGATITVTEDEEVPAGGGGGAAEAAVSEVTAAVAEVAIKE